MMRLLANENIPLASIRKLREAGLDVASVLEGSPGVTDAKVLAQAADEQRIILTFDRDYGELVFGRGLPSPLGVIYLRFEPTTPEEPATYLLELFQVALVSFEHQFTVADRTQIRQRKMP